MVYCFAVLLKTRAAFTPLILCLLGILGRAWKPCPLPGMDAGQVGIIACWNNAVFSLAAYVSKCRSRAFLVPALWRYYRGGGNVAQKRAAYILGKIAPWSKA